LLQAKQQRSHECSTVADRGIDNLALAALPRLEQRCQKPDRQKHGATADVADERRRRSRRAVPVPAMVERACECDVIDVVAGTAGKGAVLAPTGHAAIYEAPVHAQAFCRPEAEPFHDTWP